MLSMNLFIVRRHIYGKKTDIAVAIRNWVGLKATEMQEKS